MIKKLLFPWLDRDPGQPSVREDILSGQAGWIVRLALSLAAAPLIGGCIAMAFGVMEMNGGRVSDEVAVVTFGVGGIAWLGVITMLWSSYRRWRRVITTLIGLTAIWAVAIPLCVLWDVALRNEEFMIGGTIMFAISFSIALIATASYRGLGGKALKDEAGAIAVTCPHCGYSLVGLSSCACPECGNTFTIDELILAQDYAEIRRLLLIESEGQRRNLPPARDEDPESEPPSGPGISPAPVS